MAFDETIVSLPINQIGFADYINSWLRGARKSGLIRIADPSCRVFAKTSLLLAGPRRSPRARPA